MRPSVRKALPATLFVIAHLTFIRPLAAAPFRHDRFLFPHERRHNHGSCIIESPRGDLLACWFHGSGERQADDVRIEGARLRRGHTQWSPRFTMADTPGFPDTNPCLHVDSGRRLWLLYPTILANEWESALMKIHVSNDWDRPGAPRWNSVNILHVKPGPGFGQEVESGRVRLSEHYRGVEIPVRDRRELDRSLGVMQGKAGDKLYQRLGWMTRAHPLQAGTSRLIVPLYHDGYSFSMMAYTENGGVDWFFSNPLVGAGNIQPSLVRRRDGSLVTYMRDNGPPPGRLQVSESRDEGQTWSPVVDSDIPNPGAGAEVVNHPDGTWILILNDTESGRRRLSVWRSDDEGRTWKWRRPLEESTESGHEYSYPSLLVARDRTLHATYSHQSPAGRTIKHVHFNLEWIAAEH